MRAQTGGGRGDAGRRLALVAGRLRRVLWRVVGLTVLVGGITFVVVIGSTGLPEPDDRSIVAWSLVAGAVIAVLAPGAHRWLGERIDRSAAPGRVPTHRSLQGFGARMTRAVPLDELLLQLAETVTHGFARRRAEVWLVDGDTLTWTTGVPHRRAAPVPLDEQGRSVVALAGVSGPPWAAVWLPELTERGEANETSGSPLDPERARYVPLAHRGQLLGMLVVERDAAEPPFDDGDDQALERLAHQVAVALHNVELDSALQRTVGELRRRNAELQESRARLVSAADTERRRLERDLHDGAQQHLTGLSVKLQLAESLARTDPEASRHVLAEVRADLEHAKEQLRALAHGIFPPLLTIGGLHDALPAAASRAPLPVTVAAEGVGRYPPETEAAVYFCCLEALQNAAKHGGNGTRATIRVWEAPGELAFQVTDDGAGFTTGSFPEARPGSGAGHGLVNMADRLGALGGHLSVVSAPGAGTTIQGRIPLPSAPTTPTSSSTGSVG
jgi:signal transduction histidine kinase